MCMPKPKRIKPKAPVPPPIQTNSTGEVDLGAKPKVVGGKKQKRGQARRRLIAQPSPSGVNTASGKGGVYN